MNFCLKIACLQNLQTTSLVYVQKDEYNSSEPMRVDSHHSATNEARWENLKPYRIEKSIILRKNSKFLNVPSLKAKKAFVIESY